MHFCSDEHRWQDQAAGGTSNRQEEEAEADAEAQPAWDRQPIASWQNSADQSDQDHHDYAEAQPRQQLKKKFSELFLMMFGRNSDCLSVVCFRLEFFIFEISQGAVRFWFFCWEISSLKLVKNDELTVFLKVRLTQSFINVI